MRAARRVRRRLLQLDRHGVRHIEHAARPFEVFDAHPGSRRNVLEQPTARRLVDEIDQQCGGAAPGDACRVDAVGGGLFEHNISVGVVADHADERGRDAELRQSNGLVGALTAEQVATLDDRR